MRKAVFRAVLLNNVTRSYVGTHCRSQKFTQKSEKISVIYYGVRFTSLSLYLCRLHCLSNIQLPFQFQDYTDSHDAANSLTECGKNPIILHVDWTCTHAFRLFKYIGDTKRNPKRYNSTDKESLKLLYQGQTQDHEKIFIQLSKGLQLQIKDFFEKTAPKLKQRFIHTK